MKCSKCNADITGMDSHICAGTSQAGGKTNYAKPYAGENGVATVAGSTVAGISTGEIQTDAIEECIRCSTLTVEPMIARKQLAELIANQIPGRCKNCDWTYLSDGSMMNCGTFGYEVNCDHYCSNFIAKERKQ